jgi:hypothetical protein
MKNSSLDHKTNISRDLQQGTPHINIKKYLLVRKISSKEHEKTNIREHLKLLTPAQGV